MGIIIYQLFLMDLKGGDNSLGTKRVLENHFLHQAEEFPHIILPLPEQKTLFTNNPYKLQSQEEKNEARVLFGLD